ncbi:MAG: histidinol dehydrogenase, partial [Bacteroidia bacterium]
MQLIINPPKEDWKILLQRPAFSAAELEPSVQAILDAVQNEGDAAVQRYAAQFDGVQLTNFRILPAAFEAAEQELSTELKQAIELAAANIRKFHSTQLGEILEV